MKFHISYKFSRFQLIRFSNRMNFCSLSICIVILFGFFRSANVSHSEKSTPKIKFLKNDELCEKQIALLVAGYQRKDPWALKIYDSWGKSQSGMISGNLVNFGHFEQCLAVRHDFEDENFGTFLGQHCMIFFNVTSISNIKENFTDEIVDMIFPQGIHNILMIKEYIKMHKSYQNNFFGTSMCVPSFCRADKVQEFANLMLSKNGMKTQNDYDQEEFCNIINIFDIRSIDLLAS
jgi:hypothetical protein